MSDQVKVRVTSLQQLADLLLEAHARIFTTKRVPREMGQMYKIKTIKTVYY